MFWGFFVLDTYMKRFSLSWPIHRTQRVPHHLCSPPAGSTVLLQAVQIQLLSGWNNRSNLHLANPHPPTSSVASVRVHCSVVGWKKKKKNQAKCLSQLQQSRRDWLRLIFKTKCRRRFLWVCSSVLTTSHWAVSVMDPIQGQIEKLEWLWFVHCDQRKLVKWRRSSGDTYVQGDPGNLSSSPDSGRCVLWVMQGIHRMGGVGGASVGLVHSSLAGRSSLWMMHRCRAVHWQTLNDSYPCEA